MRSDEARGMRCLDTVSGQLSFKTLPIQLVILLILSIALIPGAFALSPSFNPDLNLNVFNLTQDVAFEFDVNATDPENDSIRYDFLAYWDVSHTSGWSVFSMSNSTGIIQFTPRNNDVTYPGTPSSLHEVLIVLIDNTSQTASALIRFNVSNVNDAPNITGYTPNPLTNTILENDSIGFTFDYNATDPDTPYGDILSNRWLMDGIEQTTNQSWIYFPSFCEPELRNITLVVWDLENSSDSREWNLTIINVNRAPEFNWSNPIRNITWEEDTNLIDNISLEDYFFDLDDECNSNSLTYTAYGNSSIIVNISSEEGTYVSFHVPRNWYGVEIINFSISDGYNTTYSNNIVLNVTNMPDEPIIDNISNQTAYANSPFVLQVNATSPDGLPLSYSDNTTLFEINPTTGLVSLEMPSGNIGNLSIMINVSDGIYMIATVFNIEIRNNTPPSLNLIPNQFGEQGTIFTLVVDGIDFEGDSLTFSTNYTPLGLSTPVNSTAGSFSFTPSQAQVGNRSVRVFAQDSHGASSFIDFNLSITDINSPPVLDQLPASYIIKIGKNYSIQLTASDDDDDPITFSHNANPSNFPNFQMTSAGLITIIANESDLGNHSINLSVWDNTLSNLSDSQIVLFNVTYNRNPLIDQLAMIMATEDEPFYLQINATDPDWDSLTFSSNFTVAISTNGVFNFTPTQSHVGVHNVSILVDDGDGGNATMTFLLNISGSNDPPYFDPALDSYPQWDSITENNLTYFVINATDEEEEDLTFASSFITGDELFQIQKISPNRALINFTPNSSEIGDYVVNISVADSQYTVSIIINFTVNDRNDEPTIIQVFPYGSPVSNTTLYEWMATTSFPGNITSIEASENSSIFFNHTSTDPDGDELSYAWYRDGSLVSTTQYYNYSMGYDSAGLSNITLLVNDSEFIARFTWNLTINNVNRPPVFGLLTHSTASDFLQGTATGTNVSAEGIRLDGSAGSYNESGYYVSNYFDINIDSVAGDIRWYGNIPENTSAIIHTSSSDLAASGYSEWSAGDNLTEDSGNYPIRAVSRRYQKYLLNLSTIDMTATPQISEVQLTYLIANETQVENYYTIENSSSSYWIDLDYFFSDPDGDPLNFTFTNSDPAILDVWVESWNNNHVGIRSMAAGTAYVTFTALDPYGGNATSNTVTLIFTVDPSRGSGTSSSSSSSGGSSVLVLTKTEEVQKDVDKYINLNIVVPEAVTTYQNSTVVTPIKIVNTGTKTLEGISLSAQSNMTNIVMEFTTDFVDQLEVGQETRTNLVITTSEEMGTFDLTIFAKVRNPEFTDSAKIILSTLEKGELNKTQLNTKVTFTKDLLLANPECLELTEMLKQAEGEISAGNYAKANILIEDSIRNCQGLIAAKASEMENPSALQRLYERIFGLTSKRQVLIFSIVIVAVFLILTISLIIDRIKHKRAGKANGKTPHKKGGSHNNNNNNKEPNEPGKSSIYR